MNRRQDWLASLGERLIERVAGASDRANRIGFTLEVKGPAQPPHVNVNCALIDVDIVTPDTVEKLLSRKHPPGALHQELQELELSRTEVKLPSRASKPMPLA